MSSKLKFASFVAGILSSGILLAENISAYFVGEYRDEVNLSQTLANSGFKVLATYTLDEKDGQKTVLFTSSKLQKLSSETGKGFFAIARAYSNKEANETRIENPLYFGKAFLGKGKDTELNDLSKNIQDIFGNLTFSSDKLDSKDLYDYNFQFGMPKYNDFVTVAKGEFLAEKIKQPIFKTQLENGSVIMALELDKRTKKFAKKIGSQNGILLPYLVLIEKNEAIILDPKYYIAVSYPKLSMSEFMKIASIPDAIEKDIAGEFK
jgi:hypothetical protein